MDIQYELFGSFIFEIVESFLKITMTFTTQHQITTLVPNEIIR